MNHYLNIKYLNNLLNGSTSLNTEEQITLNNIKNNYNIS